MLDGMGQGRVDIEVTPAMIEAGIMVSLDYGSEDDPLTAHLAELYRAMAAAGRPRPQE